MTPLKLFLIGCCSILSSQLYAQCSNNYELTWADEFDGTEVDNTYWNVIDAGGGFGNQEIQYYQPENATVSDGLLHIKIAHETVLDGSTTYDYTSAKLETSNKITFQYGKMEARIKMPDAVGSWPAFWMLGTNIGSVGWPHCGEIDIMEWVGRGPNAASGSIFFDGTWPNNHLSTLYNIPQGESFITDFHTFAIEWEPNEIRYYCDGNHYATYKNTSIAPKEWLFNHEFFLILNCAIGGTGGGSVISFTDPQYMEVDYVRVYSLPTTATDITVEGPAHLMENSQNVLFTTDYFPNTTYAWTLPADATLVDGAGTNSIHVNFGTQGGNVEVTATNTCATLSDQLAVSLQADACKITYDNFDDQRIVTFSGTGTLTDDEANPAQDLFNPSALVGKYERDATETYDVLAVTDFAFEGAAEYEASTKYFFMDLYTSAPVGTQITLQLENSELNGGAYPQGRRSSFIGYVGSQDSWHTVRFNYYGLISSATAASSVDYIALLFDPGHLSGDVYYFDNFRREKVSSSCPDITTPVVDPALANTLTVYPNPANTMLYINGKNEDQAFVVYNQMGAAVIESNGNKIDVSALSNGLYFLVTEGKTLKFVKGPGY